MLPQEFDLQQLDDGIRNLVITLNRIPDVNKKTTVYEPTTCEGHIWKNTSAWPTKNGWIYFYKPTSKRTGLIRRVNQFCEDYPCFGADFPPYIMKEWELVRLGLNPEQEEKLSSYNLKAHFEPHENQNGVHYMDLCETKQENFMKRAKERKKGILIGWNALDERVKDYILKNISKDIESLPYIEK